MTSKEHKSIHGNIGRKRPDLVERNKKGLSLSTRNKISEARKGVNIVYRPNNPCPKCKSIHVRSVGSSWRCVDCGKSWVKIRKGRKRCIRPDNPCPKCDSIYVNSYGKDWKCGDCNKMWRKKLKPKGWRTKNLPKPKLDGKLEEIKKLSKHMSQHQIAKKLGVSQGAISSFMSRYKIKSNPKHVWSNRDPEKQKQINKKISKALKGNTNWRFNHEFPNKEEKRMIKFFKKWNFPFKYVGDGSFKIDGKCPDFIHIDKNKKLIIEYFGEFWHKISDEPLRINFFKERGWKCLVIWGKEIDKYFHNEKEYTYAWERRLYDKILRWLAGLE